MDYSKQGAIKLFKMELEKLENDLIEIISNGIKEKYVIFFGIEK